MCQRTYLILLSLNEMRAISKTAYQ